MKAFRATQPNPSSPPTLAVEDVPVPTPQPGELLIKIRASFIQPSDILNGQASFSHTTFPRTLGRDFAGTVVQGPPHWEGKNVYGTSGGTFSFTTDGAQAEYAVVPENGVAEMPPGVGFAQAASLGTVVTTAYLTLERAMVTKADTVMVLGMSGSVGGFVGQIARVIGVGRKYQNGIEVNSVEDPTLSHAKELTGGNGPDVVVDTVGDFDLVHAAFDILNKNGRFSFITAPRGGKSTILPVDIFSLYRRQIALLGCNSLGETQEKMAKMLGELRPKFESGELKAPEEASMSFIGIDKAMDAYAGKVKRAVIVFD